MMATSPILVKVADFGMSRFNIESATYYSDKAIPVKYFLIRCVSMTILGGLRLNQLKKVRFQEPVILGLSGFFCGNCGPMGMFHLRDFRTGIS